MNYEKYFEKGSKVRQISEYSSDNTERLNVEGMIQLLKNWRNSNNMKVITVIGTRPEIIELSMVMARLDEHVDHKIIHTGQNYDYELNEVFLNLNVRQPDFFLDSAGSSLAETISNIIKKLIKFLKKNSLMHY